MRRFIRSTSLAAASLTLAVSCAPLHRSGQSPAVILFKNQSLAQADVYAVPQSGMEVRIGTVMPGRTESLEVANASLSGSPVNIVARLLASSRAPRTGPIALRPGERVQVTLPPDQSILTVLPADAP